MFGIYVYRVNVKNVRPSPLRLEGRAFNKCMLLIPDGFWYGVCRVPIRYAKHAAGFLTVTVLIRATRHAPRRPPAVGWK
jgi:hypothetical protein